MKLAPNLDEIVALARQQTELEGQIARLEEQLVVLKRKHFALQMEALPEAMAEAKLQEFVLDTGETIEIKQDFNVGILVANRPKAFSWLEGKGFGGMIKTKVIVPFGMGELEAAKKLHAQILRDKVSRDEPELSRDIHHGTLKAWVRESLQMTPPRVFPLDLFGASQYNKAIIKLPK